MGTKQAADKLRVAAEYLADITGEPREHMESFLHTLESGFPLPVQSIIPYYIITTTALSNYPEGAILLYNEDLEIFLSGGEQLGNILGQPGERPREIDNFKFDKLFNKKIRDDVEPLLRDTLGGSHHTITVPFNGQTYKITTFPVEMDHGDSIESGVAIIRNVTEEEERKQQLHEMLEERESVVKEIHHRVKNNLAVVTGLLELQAMKSHSEETRQILEESQSRVQSIATLHEKLYQTGDFKNIPLDSYIDDLVHHLEQTAVPEGMEITFSLDIPTVEVPAKKSVSCGLILNEVITNACKHAFKGRESGKINVTVSKTPGGKMKMTIKDDGIGLPEDLDIDQLDSLGMHLIDTLAAQIGGDYSFQNAEEGGTVFTLVCDNMEE